jgi:asparagine synthase (glutamine-hydrolysing)
MYQEYGPNCLHEFNGMFAFAIYNIQSKELFIARDRFGIKPLNYYNHEGRFVFSSEIKGFQSCSDINLDISFDAIDSYLTMEYIPSPFTIYKYISKLEQGHFLIYKNGLLKKTKWYNLSFKDKLNYKDECEYIIQLDDLIKNSVQSRTISDVPLGAFLSGGVDSSLITSYLSKIHTQLNTFSIGFEDASFDERDYTNIVSKDLETNHHIEIFSSDLMMEILPSIWNSMDEPFADASYLPTYILSKFTKNYVTVSLSGDGGDEVFAGYPTYFAHKLAKWIPSWTTPAFQYFTNYLPVNYNNISLDFKFKQFIKGIDYDEVIRHQLWLGSFNYDHKSQLYSTSFYNGIKKENSFESLIVDYMSNCNSEENWEKHLFQDMRFYLQDDILQKVDRCSMAHSLEVRVPFLDHQIVEFMARVPSKLKYKGCHSKYLLKKLSENYLPNEIIKRSKKGFGIPIAKWFCGILKNSLSDIIEDPNSYINRYFDSKYIFQLMLDHINHKQDNRKLLWTLYSLENWLRNNRFTEG